MVKKYILLLFVIFSCAERLGTSFKFMPFGENDYPSVRAVDLVLYSNRLAIGSKFDEIGVFVIDGKYHTGLLEKIKSNASIKGANGIIVEGNNVVLLRVLKEPIINKEGKSEGI